MKLAFATAAVALLPLAVEQPPLERYEFSRAAMGSEFRLLFYTTDAQRAETAASAAFARIASIESVLSDYRSDSEASRLAGTAGTGNAVPVSADLWLVLSRAQQVARATGGAFDVTVGPLTLLWRRAWRRGQLPAEDRLGPAREAVGFEYVRMEEAGRTVGLIRPGMRLDFGGIGKGYAIDAALRTLAEHGIERALVEGGGDLAVGAPPPGEDGWAVRLNVASPGGDAVVEIRSLARAGVASSGDAYRFVEIDGLRHSHIIDPRTGVSLTEPRQVTVVAADATMADALASAVSVLGRDGRSLEREFAEVEIHVIETRRRTVRNAP